MNQLGRDVPELIGTTVGSYGTLFSYCIVFFTLFLLRLMVFLIHLLFFE
jgi:hypothetical protein